MSRPRLFLSLRFFSFLLLIGTIWQNLNSANLSPQLRWLKPDKIFAQTLAPETLTAAPALTADTLTAAPKNTISLTAIPPRAGETGEIRVKPGQKFQTTIRVLNSGDQAIEIESFAKDFIIGDDGKTPIQVKETVDSRWSLASWLVISPSRQTIPVKKTASINVLIEVPQDAKPGGHFAMVLHQPAAGGISTKGASATGVNQQVGTLLYVVVDGAITESAFIRDFGFKPNLIESGPATFSYSIDNQSDIHLRPLATVEIYNLFNQKVGQVVVEPLNVFPGLRRDFSGTWPVTWGFGPYRAVLTVSYGSQGKIATALTTIWIIPFSIIIAIIILLLAIITGIMTLRRNRRRPPSSPDATSASVSENPPASYPNQSETPSA